VLGSSFNHQTYREGKGCAVKLTEVHSHAPRFGCYAVRSKRVDNIMNRILHILNSDTSLLKKITPECRNGCSVGDLPTPKNVSKWSMIFPVLPGARTFFRLSIPASFDTQSSSNRATNIFALKDAWNMPPSTGSGGTQTSAAWSRPSEGISDRNRSPPASRSRRWAVRRSEL